MPRRERSQARILALQALCLFDALGQDFAEDLEPFLRDAVNAADLGMARTPSHGCVAFARDLVNGVMEHRPRCDALLGEHVPHWSVGRMSPVDRNILRLGLYELLECPETPHQVVINEAVVLARLFGGSESSAFVNGVLDGLRRSLDAPARQAIPPGAAESITPSEEADGTV